MHAEITVINAYLTDIKMCVIDPRTWSVAQKYDMKYESDPRVE